MDKRYYGRRRRARINVVQLMGFEFEERHFDGPMAEARQAYLSRQAKNGVILPLIRNRLGPLFILRDMNKMQIRFTCDFDLIIELHRPVSVTIVLPVPKHAIPTAYRGSEQVNVHFRASECVFRSA